MRALVPNSIKISPHPAGYFDLTVVFRTSSDRSAAVKNAFGSTPPGPRSMDGEMGRKQYVGPIEHLRGKTALVEPRMGTAGEVMAQFEEIHLQEARGWWQFPMADFETLGSHACPQLAPAGRHG